MGITNPIYFQSPTVGALNALSDNSTSSSLFNMDGMNLAAGAGNLTFQMFNHTSTTGNCAFSVNNPNGAATPNHQLRVNSAGTNSDAKLAMVAGGLTIGTASTRDPSALTDMQSTTLGLLIPRMTSTQRIAIITSHWIASL